jgi:hypothetical protein
MKSRRGAPKLRIGGQSRVAGFTSQKPESQKPNRKKLLTGRDFSRKRRGIEQAIVVYIRLAMAWDCAGIWRGRNAARLGRSVKGYRERLEECLAGAWRNGGGEERRNVAGACGASLRAGGLF